MISTAEYFKKKWHFIWSKWYGLVLESLFKAIQLPHKPHKTQNKYKIFIIKRHVMPTD